MSEREIIINWLVGRPDDEAHPEFTRIASNALGLVGLSVSEFQSHPLVVDGTWRRKDRELEEAFRCAYVRGKDTLRNYYNTLNPESLVECFDGWCCHQYR